MIFVTVGSMFPFDRLIKAVDEWVATRPLDGEEIVAQIGDGRYEPRHMPFDRFLDKPQYEQRVQQSRALIAHAGAGTIELALAHSKPLLVVPRSSRFGEHVNDHQLATARKFEALGHVMVAYEVGEVGAKVAGLARFVPRPRVADRQRMARRIGSLIDELRSDRQSR